MNYAHPRPWLAGSIFGEGPRRKLCREARRIWRARVELAGFVSARAQPDGVR